jgi:hypothetical protein
VPLSPLGDPPRSLTSLRVSGFALPAREGSPTELNDTIRSRSGRDSNNMAGPGQSRHAHNVSVLPQNVAYRMKSSLRSVWRGRLKGGEFASAWAFCGASTFRSQGLPLKIQGIARVTLCRLVFDPFQLQLKASRESQWKAL